MGVNLSIRDVPEDWAVKLKERAKRHHRSLQGELLSILEETLSPTQITIEEVYQKIKRLNLRTTDESTQMIREDRDGGHSS